MKVTWSTMSKTGVRWTQIGLTGTWLIVLYPVLLWVVVGTLSGYGFHNKVKLVQDSDGHILTIPAIMRRAQELSEIQNQEKLLETELNEAQAMLKQSRERRTLARNAGSSWDAQWVAFKTEVLPRIKHLDSQNRSSAPPPSYKLDDIGNAFEMYADDDKLTQFVSQYKTLISEQKKIETQINNANRHADMAKGDITETEKALSQIREDAQAVLQKANVGDFISELEYVQTFKFEMFATMPSQLLTLMLTLSMGALGSLILITLDYFRTGTEKPISWYVFRPLLGMVTAVAMFILAKAGQLTISDASASKSLTENLNPFLFPFLESFLVWSLSKQLSGSAQLVP